MEELYNIWFSKIEIANKSKINLLNKFNVKEIFYMNPKELMEVTDEKNIERILDEKNKINLEKYANYLEKKKIKIINFKDKAYPRKLSFINDKPAYLFIRGNLGILDEDNVAIVGSRDASEIKKKFTRKIAKEIADRNINIVSGLALGIDKYAHLGALESKIGKTIAVLGTGLADSDIYPMQNTKIFERILDCGGAIVSEYIIGTKPLKYHFPLRNRIISGLSDKIVIVEAAENSGSLITASYALEQGKDIYAVPGDVENLKSKGTNKLIKEGAYLFENVDDLF